jgi:hypothetical protein
MKYRMKAVQVLGLVMLLAAAGGVMAMSKRSSSGETRINHHHNAQVAMASTQPPTLPYIPTYYQHVKPILELRCTGCHSEGNIAPFNLTDVKSVLAHARAAKIAVVNKSMPPWMPGGSTPKLRDERKLSPEEIAIIANWQWAGAPLGKPEAYKPYTSSAAKNLRPDLEFDTGHDFVPDGSLTDEYRCFIVEPKLEKDRFMTAYDIKPGNRKLVHHVVIYQVDQAAGETAKKLEQENGARGGYPCFGGPGIPNATSLNIFGAWVPGSGAVRLPAQTGAPIKPGQVLILQMHYNMLGVAKNEIRADRTSVKLELAQDESQIKPMFSLPLVAPVNIPCQGEYVSDPKSPCNRDHALAQKANGADRSSVGINHPFFLQYCKHKLEEYTNGNPTGISTTSCEYTFNFQGENGKEPPRLIYYGALGHMHLLGKHFKLEVIRKTKEQQTILEIPAWDFHWQDSYWLEQPVEMLDGDTLKVSCEYDNNAKNQPFINQTRVDPRYVLWGESTLDEMCATVVQIGLK